MIRVELTKGCLDVMMKVADFEALLAKEGDTLEFFMDVAGSNPVVYKRLNIPRSSIVGWYRWTHPVDYEKQEHRLNGNVYRVIGWED